MRPESVKHLAMIRTVAQNKQELAESQGFESTAEHYAIVGEMIDEIMMIEGENDVYYAALAECRKEIEQLE